VSLFPFRTSIDLGLDASGAISAVFNIQPNKHRAIQQSRWAPETLQILWVMSAEMRAVWNRRHRALSSRYRRDGRSKRVSWAYTLRPRRSTVIRPPSTLLFAVDWKCLNSTNSPEDNTFVFTSRFKLKLLHGMHWSTSRLFVNQARQPYTSHRYLQRITRRDLR